MIIKTTDWLGRSQTDDVASYVEHALSSDGWDDGGALERANRRANHSIAALSRLVDVLAERGVLTAEEVATIAGGRPDGARFG